MKPNGRRAWRKLCKSMRKREGSAYPADVARRNRKRPGFVDMRVPEPYKPFTPRSLVGMSEGAKKRAAWYEAVRAGAPPIRSNRKLRLCLKWLPQGVLNETVPLQCRLTMRAKYRIGQRLRPCQGCYRCCPIPCQGCGMLPSLDTDCETCRADNFMMAMYACDGSGVLPAKRSGVAG